MGAFCVTESNWRKGERDHWQRGPRGRGVEEGSEHKTERSDGNRLNFSISKRDEETSESRQSVDETPLDDDPRVIIGLNRLIDMIVNTPNPNPNDCG